MRFNELKPGDVMLRKNHVPDANDVWLVLDVSEGQLHWLSLRTGHTMHTTASSDPCTPSYDVVRRLNVGDPAGT